MEKDGKSRREEMLDFLRKFFFYVETTPGHYSPYSDGWGEGTFGLRHFIWMAVVILVVILAFRVFKKYPKAGLRFVLLFSILLFFTRFVNQTFRAIIGAEDPWTQAFPFHMCTVLTFLLPVVAVFDLRALKTPVYVLGIMGGIITILNGDYFGDRFLAFAAMEGMSAHTLLILIPVTEIAIGRFDMNWKESWKVPVGMLGFMGWATLANRVFYPNSGANYMYLEHNALPFGNDTNFFFFYVLIFVILFAMLYGIPALVRRIRQTQSALEKI
jgi:hypothetical integral membrane protein (TIGR02206 family)